MFLSELQNLFTHNGLLYTFGLLQMGRPLINNEFRRINNKHVVIEEQKDIEKPPNNLHIFLHKQVFALY
jgi:hypothetical protein